MTPGTHRTDKDAYVVGTSALRGPTIVSGGAYTHMTMLATDKCVDGQPFTMSSLASSGPGLPKWPFHRL